MAKSKSVTIYINGDPSGLSSGLDDAAGELDSFASGGLAKFGAAAAVGMAAAAALAGAAFVKGLMDAIDNEKVYDRLSAQLGLEDGSVLAEAWGDTTGRLYAQAYGESLGDVANTAWAVNASLGDALGPGSDGVEGAIVAASDLAAAYGLMAEDVVGTVGIFEQSGLGTVTDGFDLLAVSIGRVGPALKDDLLQAVQEYAPFAAQLGLTGEEFVGMLTQAGELGPWALDKTGDALKELTIRATDMSTGTTEAFGLIGLDAQTMANDLLAGGERANGALDTIVDGLLGIQDPATRANAAIGLFGTPLEDLTTAQIPEFLGALDSGAGALGDFGGAAERMGDTLNDNAGTKIEEFKRTVEMGLAGFFEDQVLPAFNTGLDLLAPLAEGLRTNGVDGLMEAWSSEVWPRLTEGLGTFFSEHGDEIGDGLVAALKGAGDLYFEIYTALYEGLSEGLPMLGEWFQNEAWPYIEANWQGWIAAFVGWVGPATWDMLWAFGEMLNNVGLWVVTDMVPWMALQGAEAFGSFFAWVWNDGIVAGVDALGHLIGGIGEWLRSVAPGLIADAARGLWDGIVDAMEDALVRLINAWNSIDVSTPDIWGTDFGGIDDVFPDIPVTFRASGGPVDAGRPYIVGERGPELMVPDRAGTVVPNHALGGGGTIDVSLVVDRREFGRVQVHTADLDRRALRRAG